MGHRHRGAIDNCIKEDDPEQALALLYVANELLQAHRSDATWHRVFSRAMPLIFPRICLCARSLQDAGCEKRCRGLAKVWRDREVFSVSFCDGLLERCTLADSQSTHARSPSPPEYEEEYEAEYEAYHSPAPSDEEQIETQEAALSCDLPRLGQWLGLFNTAN